MIRASARSAERCNRPRNRTFLSLAWVSRLGEEEDAGMEEKTELDEREWERVEGQSPLRPPAFGLLFGGIGF